MRAWEPVRGETHAHPGIFVGVSIRAIHTHPGGGEPHGHSDSGMCRLPSCPPNDHYKHVST